MPALERHEGNSMKSSLLSLVLLFISFDAFSVENSVIANEPGLLTVDESKKGLPNGNSENPDYLDWLEPTDDKEYGVTPEKPIEIGGLLEGAGNHWSSQYFSSILGPNGEKTEFERISTCCPFVVTNEAISKQGLKTGLLDVYLLSVANSNQKVRVYVSLYSEGKIYAPKGFTTRGK